MSILPDLPKPAETEIPVRRTPRPPHAPLTVVSVADRTRTQRVGNSEEEGVGNGLMGAPTRPGRDLSGKDGRRGETWNLSNSPGRSDEDERAGLTEARQIKRQ